MEPWIKFYLLAWPTVHLILFWLLNWKNLHADLRGKDKMWQSIEVMAYTAIVIWGSVILAGVFFGFKGPDVVYESLNLVIGASVLGVGWKQWLSHRNGNGTPEEKKEGV